jgi:hypothetical protein
MTVRVVVFNAAQSSSTDASIAARLHKVRAEQGEAIDEDRIASVFGGSNHAAQGDTFLHRGPVRRPLSAMTLDLSAHLVIIATLSGRDERNSSGLLG